MVPILSNRFQIISTNPVAFVENARNRLNIITNGNSISISRLQPEDYSTKRKFIK